MIESPLSQCSFFVFFSGSPPRSAQETRLAAHSAHRRARCNGALIRPESCADGLWADLGNQLSYEGQLDSLTIDFSNQNNYTSSSIFCAESI